ncbi:hypothetical protein [Imhoffiella purpurea]|uniref:Uncharacterized protein n=1 Tax=Imhoffiella purpurea TaxID=1249627 RepID=W9VBZ2_9GAMM|nr:hypothetical protein [Imhoffiella purpurea]EXJ16944.1 hypothetical protein D779_1767 [Imhoffiella purpurea]
MSDHEDLDRLYREEIAAKRRMNAQEEQAEIAAGREDWRTEDDSHSEYMMLHGTE